MASTAPPEAAHQPPPDAPAQHNPMPRQLMLRQMIPQPATVAVRGTADLIRRAPAAPPVGTPRRGAVRIPDSVAAAVTAAVTATDTAPTRPGPPLPASVTAGPPVTSAAGAGRTSLLDVVPVSLFERARAGLARSAPAAFDTSAPANTGTAATAGRRSSAGAFSGAGSIRRFTDFGQNISTRSAMTDIDTQAFAAPAVADALTPREWDELVDLIVDRLEDRVRDELARRGRRFSPGVF